MANSHPIDFDFQIIQTTTNIPFSWEAKPGVPKLQSRSSPNVSLFERSMMKLPSPPCRTESARLPGDYSAAIPYSPPRCRAESARISKDCLWLEAYSDDFASSFGFGCCKLEGLKESDPFDEAFKRCTDGPAMNSRSNSGGSATNCSKRPSIGRRVFFSLSRFWC